MERDEIQNIVLKHIADVLEMNAEDIPRDGSMAELGASSLDVVEVVSLTMRELKIKVPRSKLSDIENMDQLVNLLHSVRSAA